MAEEAAAKRTNPGALSDPSPMANAITVE